MSDRDLLELAAAASVLNLTVQAILLIWNVRRAIVGALRLSETAGLTVTLNRTPAGAASQNVGVDQ